jgi:SPP1 gp7 family putative phage head morphogenesis protein
MWETTFKRLLRALSDTGMNFDVTYQYADLARTLRQDAAVFAAFKNNDEQRALAKLLVDADGKPVDWATFRKAARPLTEKYNREWLFTEYSQAQASAQMAVKWEGFQEAKDLYPNLRYDAVMDEFTRDDHAALDGTVLPIDDPFWNRNYPPNGWGCRCSVSQTDKPATSKPDFKPDAGFRFNPGKDRKLFDDKTYKDVDEATALNIRANAETLLNDYLNEQR